MRRIAWLFCRYFASKLCLLPWWLVLGLADLSSLLCLLPLGHLSLRRVSYFGGCLRPWQALLPARRPLDCHWQTLSCPMRPIDRRQIGRRGAIPTKSSNREGDVVLILQAQIAQHFLRDSPLAEPKDIVIAIRITTPPPLCLLQHLSHPALHPCVALSRAQTLG
jgi:hypothetical protein